MNYDFEQEKAHIKIVFNGIRDGTANPSAAAIIFAIKGYRALAFIEKIGYAFGYDEFVAQLVADANYKSYTFEYDGFISELMSPGPGKAGGEVWQ